MTPLADILSISETVPLSADRTSSDLPWSIAARSDFQRVPQPGTHPPVPRAPDEALPVRLDGVLVIGHYVAVPFRTQQPGAANWSP